MTLDVDARFERPVYARLRRLCLALPGVVEAASHGHPVFLAGARMFCALEIIGGRPSIALKAPAADIQRLVKKTDFFATPYGRNVWISRWLDGRVNWRELEALLRRSCRSSAATAPPRRRRNG